MIFFENRQRIRDFRSFTFRADTDIKTDFIDTVESSSDFIDTAESSVPPPPRHSSRPHHVHKRNRRRSGDRRRRRGSESSSGTESEGDTDIPYSQLPSERP